MSQQISLEDFTVNVTNDTYFDSLSLGKSLDFYAELNSNKISLHSGAFQMSDSDSNTMRTKDWNQSRFDSDSGMVIEHY